MSIFIHHGQAYLEICEAESPDQATSDTALTDCLNKLRGSNNAQLKFHSMNVEQTVLEIAALFNWVEAAGGIIQDFSGRMLLIFRRGHWDLPKGKIDNGESPLQAAIREIEEETGVAGLEKQSALPFTYHLYNLNQQWFLKKTHWFLFRSSSDVVLKLQSEEDIEEAKWMPPNEIRANWNEIYPSLRPLIDVAMAGSN
jgi:8-oxo-dGTP pyrophosphatase MutT (NUDIX family)